MAATVMPGPGNTSLGQGLEPLSALDYCWMAFQIWVHSNNGLKKFCLMRFLSRHPSNGGVFVSVRPVTAPKNSPGIAARAPSSQPFFFDGAGFGGGRLCSFSVVALWVFAKLSGTNLPVFALR